MLTALQAYLADLTLINLVAQAVGFCAMATALSAFANGCDRRFYLLLIATHSLFCLHFALLGAWAGAGANAIAIFRAWFARDHRGWRTAAVFVAAYAGMACITYQQPLDLLAALAPIIGTPLMFALSGWRLRTGLLVPSSMWLTYNALVGSWPGVINELIVIAINLTTIARLLRRDLRPAPAAPLAASGRTP